ncbi:MAG: hypothetical protein U9N31_09545 [Candidatus Marinimicrobia bacterium]|nr:hypothetical protein [Candidatus Neomarinimicrobiota bacterium]
MKKLLQLILFFSILFSGCVYFILGNKLDNANKNGPAQDSTAVAIPDSTVR